jgi:hypothetical protein
VWPILPTSSCEPVSQVVFTYLNVPEGLASDEAPLSPFPFNRGKARTDFSMLALELPDGFTGGVEFALDLFHQELVERMCRSYEELLVQLGQDPGRTLAELMECLS